MRDRGVCSPLVFDASKDPGARSLTRQSFAKDADINVIMSKYANTGVLVDPLNVDSARQPRFGDFSDIVDYPQLVTRIAQAKEDFMTLPSAVRAQFDNDVENVLAFIADPVNLVEAVSLKLLPESMLPVVDSVDVGAPVTAPKPVLPAS